MAGDPPIATGVTRRRRRLTDQETEQRMLQAAVDQVNSAGLTVSLEHISFEDVIRDAGVSRSAVYRRWPYKDLFFSDLLKELARGTSPAIVEEDPEARRAVDRTILDRVDWLRTPSLRVALAAEILRHGAPVELRTFLHSPEWRTYLALHATFLSLPEGELRGEVQAALTESERNVTAGLAAAYERVASLLGLRMRPELASGFETLATLANAMVRGLVVMAPTTPALSEETIQADLFGAPAPAEWTLPALALGALAASFLEADPDVVFDDDRIAEVRRALARGE
ncbi:AcrR family transcriptional regulator [Nocardiopsis mwathae]|uniref:AcrR family transcriptional regulator n=1 Tax=Nocardiopsis mwathae TaxID=1472723 RepID=A0A7X0D7S2_9ACTN|nr:TetR/AcrR family transcriptional regulator [Nocardiopsis mwathae]MBB6174036.1 AcrR family transcriptional regulator [Nocardiopsis mwathae]